MMECKYEERIVDFICVKEDCEGKEKEGYWKELMNPICKKFESGKLLLCSQSTKHKCVCFKLDKTS